MKKKSKLKKQAQEIAGQIIDSYLIKRDELPKGIFSKRWTIQNEEIRKGKNIVLWIEEHEI